MTVAEACAKIGSAPMRTDQMDPEVVDEEMAAVLKGKTPAERLRVAFGLWTSTKRMLERILRSQHPDWDDIEVQKEVAKRMSHGTG